MQNLKQAISHLQKDPVLYKIIAKFGLLNYPANKDYFSSIVGSIISQQLSNKAAATIYDRFVGLFPKKKFTPELILSTPLEKLRSVGTSWAKAKSLHDLSQKVIDGTLQLNKLSGMTDAQVITHLTQVKGVGQWTAEMKLMFTLHRPDVLPLDDVGIQNAMVALYKLNRKTKNFQKHMLKIAKPWQPYRTVACWYLWKSLDNKG